MKKGSELYNEGYCYYTGSNMYPLNYQRALDCFLQAAELGECEAMNAIAIMYENGNGVRKDINTALNWYDRAANAGCSSAMVTLAERYEQGNGVRKNEKKAHELYDRAYATDQNPHAAFDLAQRCMARKEYIEAARFFKLAAEKGKIPEAWHNLGILISKYGVRSGNVDRNLEAAIAYKNAAEMGVVESMFNYALTVQIIAGGVNKEVMEWLQKAADKGYEPAKKRIKMLRFSQSGSFWDLIGR